MPDSTPETELTFEQALEQVERIVERIESGEVGLERSIAEYERGMTLLKTCRQLLQRAELKVEEVTTRMNDEAPPSASPRDDAARPADSPSEDPPF